MLPLFMTLFLTFPQHIVIMLENVKRSFLQEQTAKVEALERVVSLEERLKALEEENASLKLSADKERSAKDRLLALVHLLTGLFFPSLINLVSDFGTHFAFTEGVAPYMKQVPWRFPKLREHPAACLLPSSRKPKVYAVRFRRRRKH